MFPPTTLAPSALTNVRFKGYFWYQGISPPGRAESDITYKVLQAEEEITHRTNKYQVQLYVKYTQFPPTPCQ